MESTECIVSPWFRNDKGYACRSKRIGKKVTKVYAHRLAWEEVHGPIPEGMTIHHKCGVKPCTNVQHLELKTLAENGRIGRPCPDTACTCTCHQQ